jgi:hypothetical protein
MRYGMLICCLVAMAPLGCGKASGTRTVTSIPTNVSNSDDAEDAAAWQGEDAAPWQGELALHHGLGIQADFGTGPEVRLDAITLTAPAQWKRTRPGSSYYAAEFILPHVGNHTTDGRVLVSVGSGSLETNLDVFKGEFDTAGEYAKQEQKEIAGLQVTFVDVTGAYTGQHSQSGPAATLPGYRMILAAIPIGDQLHFIKAVGPEQTIAANREAIDSFVRSLQRRDAAVALSEAAPVTGNEICLKPLTLTAPATWKRTQPRSSLVQAEFALPHADKESADGRLTVSIVTGTVKDNVDRWKGQFVGPSKSFRQEERRIAGLKATLVDFAGTFGEQAGMMGAVVNRPDYRMIAAIIPISDQLYIVKAVGPRQTIAANVEAINSFVGSLRRDE